MSLGPMLSEMPADQHQYQLSKLLSFKCLINNGASVMQFLHLSTNLKHILPQLEHLLAKVQFHEFKLQVVEEKRIL